MELIAKQECMIRTRYLERYLDNLVELINKVDLVKPETVNQLLQYDEFQKDKYKLVDYVTDLVRLTKGYLYDFDYLEIEEMIRGCKMLDVLVEEFCHRTIETLFNYGIILVLRWININGTMFLIGPVGAA